MSLTDYEEEKTYIQKVYNNLKIATREYETGNHLKSGTVFIEEMRTRYGKYKK